jgi:zinc transport system substrate-binding protein
MAALSGCRDAAPTEATSGAPSGPAADEIRELVSTTFHPSTYWAARIAGDLVAVDNPLPWNVDPADWTPGADALASYRRSRLVAVNGDGYEIWLDELDLPDSRIVRLTADLDPGRPAGHPWLDPISAIRQATTLADAMKRTWPQYAEAFDANLAGLVADLEDLDAQFRALTPRLESVVLIGSQPEYDVLAGRYGWSIDSLELDPDALPSAEDLAAVRASIPANRGPAQQVIVLWESEPLDEIRQLFFVDMGVECVVVRPAETVTEEEFREDWKYLEIMQNNVDQIAGVLPPVRN